MKSLLKVRSFAIYILLVCVFCACEHCDIEQEVCIDSYYDDTRYIKTEVWVKDGIGFPISLEMMEYDHDLTLEKVDSVKAIRMQEAIAIKTKIDVCIKNAH